jgi:hypothetical protein
VTFRISALPRASFEHLFNLSDDALAAHGAVRRIVDAKPGYPCRISLEDAEIGETVILVHYEHQPAPTPFRAGHAVYVRPGVEEARPEVDAVPRPTEATWSRRSSVCWPIRAPPTCTYITPSPAATRRGSTGAERAC